METLGEANKVGKVSEEVLFPLAEGEELALGVAGGIGDRKGGDEGVGEVGDDGVYGVSAAD